MNPGSATGARGEGAYARQPPSVLPEAERSSEGRRGGGKEEL